jgi:hypothetical protein
MTYTNALKRRLTAVNREITDTSESGNTRRSVQFLSFFGGGSRGKNNEEISG